MKTALLIRGILYCLILTVSRFVSADTSPVVTILADDSYPPYSYVEDGQLKGIYVDIVAQAAQLIAKHYQVKLIGAPWKRGLREIKEGSAFAILPPYQHIEKRPFIWPYSIALMTEVVVAFCQQDINIKTQINEVIPTKEKVINIGINSGYLILNKELERAKKQGAIKIQENKDTHANIMKLFYKRIDCYVNDRISTLWELSRMQKNNTKMSFDRIDEALLIMTQTAHIGYSDNEKHQFHFKEDFIERMDVALSRLRKSGKIEAIIARYLH